MKHASANVSSGHGVEGCETVPFLSDMLAAEAGVDGQSVGSEELETGREAAYINRVLDSKGCLRGKVWRVAVRVITWLSKKQTRRTETEDEVMVSDLQHVKACIAEAQSLAPISLPGLSS